jgi:Family of unknown function (DUF5681)
VSNENNPLTITVDQQQPRKRNPPSTAYTTENPSPNAFEPGTSGNPGGKPKQHRLLTRSLRARLDQRAPDEIAKVLKLPRGASYAQCISAQLVNQSLRGDMNASRLIFEYTEGPPLQKVAFGLDPDLIEEEGGAGPRLIVQFTESEHDRLRREAQEHESGRLIDAPKPPRDVDPTAAAARQEAQSAAPRGDHELGTSPPPSTQRNVLARLAQPQPTEAKHPAQPAPFRVPDSWRAP